MNIPSHYQSAFFRALNARDEGVSEGVFNGVRRRVADAAGIPYHWLLQKIFSEDGASTGLRNKRKS
jgi:hypothetical protein